MRAGHGFVLQGMHIVLQTSKMRRQNAVFNNCPLVPAQYVQSSPQLEHPPYGARPT